MRRALLVLPLAGCVTEYPFDGVWRLAALEVSVDGAAPEVRGNVGLLLCDTSDDDVTRCEGRVSWDLDATGSVLEVVLDPPPVALVLQAADGEDLGSYTTTLPFGGVDVAVSSTALAGGAVSLDGAGAPPDRPPFEVTLVLDRSF